MEIGVDPDTWRGQVLYASNRFGGKQLLRKIVDEIQASGIDYEMGMVVLANAIACSTAIRVTGTTDVRQLTAPEMSLATTYADTVRRLIEERLRSYGVG